MFAATATPIRAIKDTKERSKTILPWELMKFFTDLKCESRARGTKYQSIIREKPTAADGSVRWRKSNQLSQVRILPPMTQSSKE